jgi:hypothetical protein
VTLAPRRLARPLLALLVSAGCALGCEVYEGPPRITIEGLQNGLLSDAKAPIVVGFSKPIDPSTLHVKLAKDVVDDEGNVSDTDDDPITSMNVLLQHDPGADDVGGSADLSADGQTLTLTPDAPLQVGPKLTLIFDAGLSDTAGHATGTRRRLVFGYRFDMHCNAPVKGLGAGVYFFLVEVRKPIPTQIKLYSVLDVDAATGRVLAQFTSGHRNPAPGRCPMPCDSSDVCRLLPEPACVPQSEKAGSVDEYPDYVPNPSPPTGYTFTTRGCLVDQADGSVAFANAPVDVEVLSPHVTLRNTRLTASFSVAGGVARGQGSLVADAVLLGTAPSGQGEGDLTVRSLPAADVPQGLPKPIGTP